MKIKKNENGFVGADIIIGFGILMLFIALITTIYINSNQTAMLIQRNARASEIITNIFEKIDLCYYDEVPLCDNVILKCEQEEDSSEKKLIANTTDEEAKLKLENIFSELNIPNGYTVNLSIKNYKPDNESNVVDLVKNVEVTVNYNISKKQEEISMNKLKTRENIIIPNTPVIESEMQPIKYDSIVGEWYSTEVTDKQWYNYENISIVSENNITTGIAYSAKIEDITVDINGKVTFKEGKNPKAWVPCYGKIKNKEEYKYLYSTTGKATKKSNESGALINIISDENVEVQEIFKNKSGKIVNGLWIELGDTNYTSYIGIIEKISM